MKDNNDTNRQNPTQFLEKNCLIGNILGFKLKKSDRIVQHKLLWANTQGNTNYDPNIIVLGEWFVCQADGVLVHTDCREDRQMNIGNYIGTIKKPTVLNKNAQLVSKITPDYSIVIADLAALL